MQMLRQLTGPQRLLLPDVEAVCLRAYLDNVVFICPASCVSTMRASHGSLLLLHQ